MSEVPTVDIAALFAADPDEREAGDRAVAAAVAEAGCFVVSGYPDAAEIDRRAAVLLAFFDLPAEEKAAVATRVTNPEGKRIYRGYVASLKPGDWAHNEMFDIGPDEPRPGPSIPGGEILAERNNWPAREPVAGWQATMRAYYAHLREVALAVMLAAGRSAGFAEADLRQRFDGGNSTLRLLNYPVPPPGSRVIDELPDLRAGAGTPRLAAGRHTDGSGVSLLWQGQPGLQAQGPDGRWRDIPQAPNGLSVHLGDVLEIMTDGAVPATPHRVLDHGVARQSAGFFLEPALGAHLTPVAKQLSEAERHSAKGTYAWHLLRRISGYEGYETLVPRPE